MLLRRPATPLTYCLLNWQPMKTSRHTVPTRSSRIIFASNLLSAYAKPIWEFSSRHSFDLGNPVAAPHRRNFQLHMTPTRLASCPFRFQIIDFSMEEFSPQLGRVFISAWKSFHSVQTGLDDPNM